MNKIRNKVEVQTSMMNFIESGVLKSAPLLFCDNTYSRYYGR